MLAGALIPTASAQGVYIIEYDDLYQAGDTVYAYTWTDINLPVCGEYPSTSCWLEYYSHARATLYKGAQWIGSYWWEQYCGWSSAWGYDALDAGVWELDATHELYDIWYMDSIGWPAYESHLADWPTVFLDINPEIYIADTQDVWDGDAGYFNVVAHSGTPTWYEWWFDNFSPAGNSPYVNFSPPNDNPTVTDAHWYAYPDQECGAQFYAYYEIDVNVWFGSIGKWAHSWMNVWVPEQGGATWPPQFTSLLWVPGCCQGSDYYPVTAFATGPPTTMIEVSYQSQFFQKAWEHEQVHVDQFVGSQGLMRDVYSATELANRVAPLRDPTQYGLHTKVWDAINAYLQWSASEMNTRCDAAEIQAYAVSDIIWPRYLWQRCGRVHF